MRHPIQNAHAGMHGEYMAPRRSRLQRAIWTVGTTYKEKSKNANPEMPYATEVAYPPLRRPSRGFARFAAGKVRPPLTAVLAAGTWQL